MSNEIALAFPVGRDARIKEDAALVSRYRGHTGTILGTECGVVELRIHGAPDPAPGSCHPAFSPSECELLPEGWNLLGAMPVVYIAHPLRGETPEATATNRRRASVLTAAIAAKHKIAPVASWVILSEHWTEEEGRELGLKIDCALIGRCDELWLCGPVKALSAGMQIEHDHAVAHGLLIIDKRGVFE